MFFVFFYKNTINGRLNRSAYVFIYFYENAFYYDFMMLFLNFAESTYQPPDVYLSLHCSVYIFEILNSVNHKLIYTCTKVPSNVFPLQHIIFRSMILSKFFVRY